MSAPPRLVARTAAALSEMRARVDALLAQSAGPPSGDTLHDLRVALRRIAALARLTGDAPEKGSGRALRVAARDLRRALSTRRTQEVARESLLVRFRHDPRRRAIAERLAERLGRSGNPAASSVETGKLLGSLRRALANRDASLSKLHAPLGDESDAHANARLARRVRRRLRHTGRRLERIGTPAAGSLHPARILARELRYGLRFAGNEMPASKVLVPLLADFQDTAGSAHDLAELIVEVRRLAGRSRASERRATLRLLPSILGAEERALACAQASSRRLLSQLRKSKFEWR